MDLEQWTTGPSFLQKGLTLVSGDDVRQSENEVKEGGEREVKGVRDKE